MSPNQPSDDVIRDHRRQWRDCRYVYPVISRRARGLSIGVNLNPDKQCTFACVYCQIDRSVGRGPLKVDIAAIREELKLALQAAISGELWEEPRFRDTPRKLRRINDIAFSGDGEPTCAENFDRAVKVAADVKAEMDLPDVKLVAITNASQLRSEQVRRALPTLDDHNGEIWAKLDAGTEEFFRQVNRPHPDVTLEHILHNILAVAVARPVVIQTLLFETNGEPPSEGELDAYTQNLRRLIADGARIKLIQLHTVARKPAEENVAPLGDAALEALANRLRRDLPGVPVEVFGGASQKHK